MEMDAVQTLQYWLKKAQPAPWEIVESVGPKGMPRWELYAADTDVADFWNQSSATFCELARNLLPEVLAEITQLRAELAALKEVARG